MKTLKGHKILYDEVCPMCNMYTKAFVKTCMLDKDGRQPYQQLPEDLKAVVDTRRAVNEIALVNTKTGEVAYGVKSLFLILQNSFPFLKLIFRQRMFSWLADKAYKFISYNRRVIIPVRREASLSMDEPSFNRRYRVLYLLFTWLVTAFVLNRYAIHLQPLIPGSSFYREWAVCGGQIAWQALVIGLLAPEKRWNYLGNLMTISFGGALLLLLIQAFFKWIDLGQPHFYAVAFIGVAGLMFLEHIRRTKILQLHWIMTFSWVIYRLVLLILILNF